MTFDRNFGIVAGWKMQRFDTSQKNVWPPSQNCRFSTVKKMFGRHPKNVDFRLKSDLFTLFRNYPKIIPQSLFFYMSPKVQNSHTTSQQT